MRRSSHRLATKRSLEDIGPNKKSKHSSDSEEYHRPKAGETPQLQDCGILPGE
jgi:hypothetical protein